VTTITSTYKIQAMLNPDKIAIQTTSHAISNMEWHKIVCRTANWLDSITDSNKTVGIFMPSSVAFLQLFTGAAMAGCVAATFDAKWKTAELERRLAVSSPSVLITTKKLADRLSKMDLNIIIWEDAQRQIQENDSSWNKEIDGETPFYMGFTSGSTGVPKAFIRSHNSWVASFSCTLYDFHVDDTDIVVIPGALIHSHFLYGAVSTLYLGGTIYLMENFSAVRVLEYIETFPVTVLYVVPTMIEAMLAEKRLVTKPLKIISSGAKWEESSKRKIREQFLHLSMFEFYGASELSYVTVLSDEENKIHPGSVGKPCHNVELEIRNDNIQVTETGQIGKIFVRSSMVFSGYIHPQSRDIQSIHDKNGWVTVDDMGYLDDLGFLHIVGREKNMILFGAVNIFPEEIETVLMAHPDVEEVAVIGVSDPYWGQIPIAVIKGKAPKKELKKLCRENLSIYKQPRKWYFVDMLPHTTSGKIARVQTQQLIESEVESN
jgi:long-chain acyl-CoA synthetase